MFHWGREGEWGDGGTVLFSFHFISFYFILFHFISFYFILFHFISFHFVLFCLVSFWSQLRKARRIKYGWSVRYFGYNHPAEIISKFVFAMFRLSHYAERNREKCKQQEERERERERDWRTETETERRDRERERKRERKESERELSGRFSPNGRYVKRCFWKVGTGRYGKMEGGEGGGGRGGRGGREGREGRRTRLTS